MRTIEHRGWWPARTHRTRDANERQRWLARHALIERETRTRGGGGTDTARPHCTQDTNKRWRWWASTDSSNARHEREVEVALTQHALIKRETRTSSGSGTDTLSPNVRRKQERRTSLLHPHQSRIGASSSQSPSVPPP